MLNLIDPVIYTPDELQHVREVLRPLFSAGWDDQKNKTKALKHRIDSHTMIAQHGRCAYCEKVLLKGEHAIEHIAPRGRYGEFCFEPFNLVNACTSCNSPSNKRDEDTIVAPADRTDYDNNRFKIVHPYLDNPDDHIRYVDGDKTIFDMQNCSAKGVATITMFHWNESWAYTQRVINAKTRDVSIDVLKMVAEISSYK